MNVVVTGGGTAGHVFPALATASAHRDAHGASIVFIGATDGQEARLVPEAGFRFVPVRVAAAQTRLSFATVRAVALAIGGSRSVRPIVRGADVVVSIGGFASAPAALAARRTRVPLILIEPNSVPGVVSGAHGCAPSRARPSDWRPTARRSSCSAGARARCISIRRSRSRCRRSRTAATCNCW
jgi:UDP-N-acetylglucosamine--N-acetylmuramyl-(pentapeptide) pyrophosphoryl-undecaprenol N-acetylglucosamine transferase